MGAMPTANPGAPQRLRLLVSVGMGVATVGLGTPLLVAHSGFALGPFLALCGLAAALVGPAVVLVTERRQLITAVHLVCGVVTSACLGIVALSTGGSRSPSFLSILALPLAFSVISRETPLVSFVSGVTVGIFAGLIFHLEGFAAVDVAVVSMQGVTAGAVGWYGTWLYWKLREAELKAEHERCNAVTELALLQRQSAEAERLAAVGRLAAGVAHEINNPLAFVSSNVSFLADQKLAREHDEVLAETAEGLRRIQRIVSDLTDFARPASQAQESCDPSASIETAVRIASVRAKGIAAFKVETTPLSQPLAMNGARLVQVLVNLLLNAVDAIESGPRRETPGNVWIQLAPGKLVVADDGPGLSAEAVERMFEPFFTTKPRGKGTGLGLALCRQYLSEHGYSITADGRPGGGARFIVNFT